MPGVVLVALLDDPDDLVGVIQVDPVPDPGIRVVGQPAEALPRAADRDHRQPTVPRHLREKVNRAVQGSVVLARELSEMAPLVRQGPNHLPRLPEMLGTIIKRFLKGRIFYRSVPRQHPQDEAVISQDIRRNGRLSNVNRLPQRGNHPRGPDRNLAGLGRQVPHRHHRVEPLTDVTKVGIVKRHVTDPQGCEPRLLDQLGRFSQVTDIWNWRIRVTLERSDQPKGQLSLLKHPGKAVVAGQVGRQGSLIGTILSRVEEATVIDSQNRQVRNIQVVLIKFFCYALYFFSINLFAHAMLIVKRGRSLISLQEILVFCQADLDLLQNVLKQFFPPGR